IEPVLGEGAVLGSNTSTIPIVRLASMFRQPERLVGLHFFHPVGQRPLVEIIRSEQTADRAFAGALAVAKAFDRPAILVGDSPGFVVNRLLMPYLTEAMELLLEGVSIDRIESVARSFGMAKGPLELLDEIGLDTTLHGGRILWETWPDRITVSPLLIPMYKKHLHGVKTGGGFFVYDPDGLTPAEVNPAAVELIAYWSRASQESDSMTDEQIVERLLRPMADEARRLLDEQVVTDPRDIQLAALLALGFPEQHLDYLSV
ncbi:MAG: 3-hydroxyacyl-CoA dehydrogenase family protein, partial [Planctomycetia bacterium]